MGQLGTYYFNGNSFAQATSVFTDSDLTTLAPDGYYSNAGIVRQQLLGILLSAETCSTCCVPCNALVSVFESTSGVYSSCLELGGGTGAVIFRIQTGFVDQGPGYPAGTIITHDGSNYNRFTIKYNHNGIDLVDENGTQIDYAGINNNPTDPTYVGVASTNTTFVATYDQTPTDPCEPLDQLEDFTYESVTGSFVEQGTYQTVVVNSNQVGFYTQISTNAARPYTLVFPKTNAASTFADMLNYSPLCGTGMTFEVECPAQLPFFDGEEGTVNIPFCTDTPTFNTYYFARNSDSYNFETQQFDVDTNTTPDVGNFVFTTSDGSVYLNDTSNPLYYYIDIPSSPGVGEYIRVRNGVVIEKGPCQPQTP
jgi:hypothetical protein